MIFKDHQSDTKLHYCKYGISTQTSTSYHFTKNKPNYPSNTETAITQL